MATKIHHATAKKAKSHGIELVADADNEIVAMKGGRRLASHMSGTLALAKALEVLAGEQPASVKAKKAPAKCKARDEEESEEPDPSDDETEAEGDEDEEGKSVVKHKYKQAYRPFKMTCGDDLAHSISRHITAENKDGDMRIDANKLRRFAIANDCWNPDYRNLNIGMQRMNVANRLRSKVKKGHKIVWA